MNRFELLGLEAPQFAGEALWKLLADYDFATVLDVGCGAGEAADVFLAFGKEVTAVDYGRSVYFARAPGHLNTRIGDFATMQFETPFDCVWCAHVLEHQRNAGVFIDRLVAATREGGVLAISVPPAKSQIVGGHVSLWNAGLLLYQLVLAGLDCAEAAVASYGYNVSVIVRKRSITLPADLAWDSGDLRRLRPFLPASLPFEPNELDDPFNGEITRLNW
jgi:SAM-dependent methyltransferase